MNLLKISTFIRVGYAKWGFHYNKRLMYILNLIYYVFITEPIRVTSIEDFRQIVCH